MRNSKRDKNCICIQLRLIGTSGIHWSQWKQKIYNIFLKNGRIIRCLCKTSQPSSNLILISTVYILRVITVTFDSPRLPRSKPVNRRIWTLIALRVMVFNSVQAHSSTAAVHNFHLQRPQKLKQQRLRPCFVRPILLCLFSWGSITRSSSHITFG